MKETKLSEFWLNVLGERLVVFKSILYKILYVNLKLIRLFFKMVCGYKFGYCKFGFIIFGEVSNEFIVIMMMVEYLS